MFNTEVIKLKTDIATCLNNSKLPSTVKQMVLKEVLGQINLVVNNDLIQEKNLMEKESVNDGKTLPEN